MHSFREKQEIDFEALCSGGVFGIFGPTGSGKSSILDAMTLALYGKVERASNNTQGIMNHAENQLSVSFTFELANAKSTKRYRIERKFKRTDDIRIKTSICRLMEEGDETVVLADKANEVNEKIHELLGLTIDDFTRAVVLPQGKFAEFLSLKGSERRQMLQRIFHLEKYGDVLTKKLKLRLQTSKATYNELSAEQTGLGDASKEAVEQAKEAVNERIKHLEQVEKEHEHFTQAYDEQQQIWQWLNEQQLLLQKQETYQKQKEDFQKIEKQLIDAEEAERLKPYAEAVKELTKEQSTYEAETNELTAKVEITKKQFEEKKQAFEHIRQERAQQEPVLMKRREKLHQFKDISEELKNDEQLVTSLQRECKSLQSSFEQTKTEIRKIEDILTRALEKQAQLKKELKETSVRVEEREKLQTALQKKQQINQLNTQVSEIHQSIQKKNDQLQSLSKQWIEIDEKKRVLEKQLVEKYFALNRLFELVSERHREMERFGQWLKIQIKTVRANIEKVRTHEVAKQLAKDLIEGEACPVCGSTDHPAPQISSSAEELSKWQKKLDTLENDLDSVMKEEQHIRTLKLKLEDLSETIVKEQIILQEVRDVTAATIEPLIHYDALSENESIEHVFKQFVTETKALQQDFLSIKGKLTNIHEEIRRLQEIKLQQEPLAHSIETEVKELEEKQQWLYEQLEEEKKNWIAAFEDVPIDEVEDKLERLKQKEELVEQLTERIEKSVAFIEEKERLKQVLKEQEYKTSNELSAKTAELKAKQQSVQEKEKRFKEENINIHTLHEELIRVEHTLKHYQQQEQSAYEEWQQLSNQLHDLQRKWYTAKKQWEDSQKKLEKAEVRWHEEKQSSKFEQIEEALMAVLPAEEKQRLKEKVTVYQEAVKEIETALQNVTEKLNGRTITKEQWEQLQTKKREMKERLNNAIAEKGAAQTQLTTILNKHERFMEIEEEKHHLERHIEQLNQLQSIFKGNSFVEYIAEEQLEQVSFDASERLGQLTRRRYAIEVDSQGGFIIRDDANGGVKRPVTTLSGGETFMTSLALALSLSAQIQLRGQYPLQFFFLDEGFGTLDSDLLDTVVSALEKLHSNNLSVGVISHVQELRARLPKRLIVEQAEPSGRGTRVKIETI